MRVRNQVSCPFQGVINANKRLVPNLTFGGPSKLSPIIHTASDIVRKTKLSQDNQLYHVLMIITVSIFVSLYLIPMGMSENKVKAAAPN